MTTSPVVRSVLRGAALVALALFATVAAAQRYVDPPARVARLSHFEGPVTFSPAGTDDWRRAQRNRPHWRGDRFWTDRRARAELQMGGAALRLDQRTAVEILELDDRNAQFELTEGTVNLSVRHIDRNAAYEIATPMFALVVDRRAVVRVDVDPRSGRTEVVMWEGTATAYGQRGRFPLHEGDAVAFYDSTLRDYEFLAIRPDGFDAYTEARDERLERSASLRYVPAGLIGYAELDDYGSWRTVSDYGPVWFPSRVGAAWRPYRDGHWIWQEPWGWTWVDDADWGFATSHYGRWVQVDRRWGWIPSPRRERPVYAPALVSFVSFGVGSGPVGWFPLGPREVYIPTYRTSRDYFARVNYGNTSFGDRAILSRAWTAYDRGQRLPELSYRYNRGEYWTAVPRETFVGARPVARSVVQQQDSGAIAQLDRIRALEPRRESRYGATAAAAGTPPREAFQRQVYTRHVAPPRAQRADAPTDATRAEAPRDRRGDARDNVRVIREAELPVIARDAPRSGRPGGAGPAARAQRPESDDAFGGRRRDVGDAPRREREAERGAGPREERIDGDSQRAPEEAVRDRRGRDRDAGEAEAAQSAREAERAAREAEREQRESGRQRDAAQQQEQAQREAERSQREQERQSREREQADREAERQAREQQQTQRQAEAAQREQQQAQREAQRQAEAAQREQEQAQREAQRQAEAAQREQQQAQREAERQAREQEQAQREAQRQAREQEQAQREAQRQAEETQRELERAQREAEREAQQQARQQQEAQREQERQARELEQAQREQQRQAEAMQREAERQAREQQRAQQEAAQPAEGEERGRGRGRGRDDGNEESEEGEDEERGRRGRPPR